MFFFIVFLWEDVYLTIDMMCMLFFYMYLHLYMISGCMHDFIFFQAHVIMV